MNHARAVRARILTQVPALGERVYPQRLPQGPIPPAATYEQVGMGADDMTLDGPSGLRGPRVRVNVWAGTEDEVDTVAASVRGALHGFRGLAGADVVDGAFLAADVPLYEEDTELYRRMLEFNVYGRE